MDETFVGKIRMFVCIPPFNTLTMCIQSFLSLKLQILLKLALQNKFCICLCSMLNPLFLKPSNIFQSFVKFLLMHASFTHKMKKSFRFIPYSYIFNLVLCERVTENEVIKFATAN